ncbi:MAG: hypothetical protein ACOC1P_02450, partial [Minisyncoccales bacterium]
MKKKKVFVLFCVIVFIFSISIIFSSTSTNLEIANSPPYLEKEIPLISFEKGNHTNALDLSNYFKDYERDKLNFDYDNPYPEILNISISNEGKVNFSALKEINQTGEIYFYANDGFYVKKSNPVKFYLGEDLLPPYFSNQSISKKEIFQYDFVDFNINVYDDRTVEKVELILDKEKRKTEKISKKIENKSAKVSFKKQIISPTGDEVKWEFCIYDSYNNSNCTSKQSFYVQKKPENETEEKINYSLEKDNFFVEPEYLLVMLKQGKSVTKTIEIENDAEGILEFNIHLKGLKDIIHLNEKNFSIEGKKSKSFSLDFVAEENLVPGEYTGKIIVDSIGQIEIPCIVNINPVNIGYE